MKVRVTLDLDFNNSQDYPPDERGSMDVWVYSALTEIGDILSECNSEEDDIAVCKEYNLKWEELPE